MIDLCVAGAGMCKPKEQCRRRPAVCKLLLNAVLTQCRVPLRVQALLCDRAAFHALLGKLDSLRSMWRFEVSHY